MPHLPWMWYVLGAMAVWYLYDYVSRLQRHGPVPSPCREPAALLVRGAKVVWRLWPLVLLIMASAVAWQVQGEAATARMRAQLGPSQHEPASGAAYSSSGEVAGVAIGAFAPSGPPRSFGFVRYVSSCFTGRYWVYYRVQKVFGGGGGVRMVGLLLAVAIALWGWIAVWDPWELGKGARLICALCAVGGLTLVAEYVALWKTGFGAMPRWLVWLNGLGLLPALVAASLFGAVVTAILWHAAEPHEMRAEVVGRTAMKVFPTLLLLTLVAMVVFFPVTLATLLMSMGSAVRHMAQVVFTFDSWSMRAAAPWQPLVLFVCAWAPWIAAETGGSAVQCLLGAPQLILKAPGLFALLTLRLSVLVVALTLAEVALAWLLVRAGPAHYANAAIRGVLGLWVGATALFAYRSFAYEVKLMPHHWYERVYWQRLLGHSEAA